MKGKVAGRTPIKVELEEGKMYAWCSCGLSTNEPFCSGAHNGTDFTPIRIKAEESKTVYMCNCKQTSTPPYCDGSHSKLL